MAKLIKKLKNGTTRWRAEEGDPIYSEGWTIGAATFMGLFQIVSGSVWARTELGRLTRMFSMWPLLKETRYLENYSGGD